MVGTAGPVGVVRAVGIRDEEFDSRLEETTRCDARCRVRELRSIVDILGKGSRWDAHVELVGDREKTLQALFAFL